MKSRTEPVVPTRHRSECSKQQVLARIREAGVIPVIRVPAREQAILAARGVVMAKLGVVEITLTVPDALEVIQELRSTHGRELLLGAGTVLDASSCRFAIEAGADFIVSPVFDAEVLEVARHFDTLFIAGALTPTEMLRAWRAGADLVKIFPAGSMGGPSYVRALKGPFPDIEVVVTGGVSLKNLPEFLSAGACAVGVGEAIFSSQALAASQLEIICENACRFVEAARSARASQALL